MTRKQGQYKKWRGGGGGGDFGDGDIYTLENYNEVIIVCINCGCCV